MQRRGVLLAVVLGAALLLHADAVGNSTTSTWNLAAAVEDAVKAYPGFFKGAREKVLEASAALSGLPIIGNLASLSVHDICPVIR